LLAESGEQIQWRVSSWAVHKVVGHRWAHMLNKVHAREDEQRQLFEQGRKHAAEMDAREAAANTPETAAAWAALKRTAERLRQASPSYKPANASY
jgi:hypothetical protein